MTDAAKKSIIEALDLAALPAKDQEDILLTLSDLIFKGSLARIIEGMDDAVRESFSALFDSGASEEEINAFLETYAPDSDKAVQETIDEIAGDILAVSA
jgi:hypothetical protein